MGLRPDSRLHLAWKKPEPGRGPDSEPGSALVLAPPTEGDGGAEGAHDLQVGGGDVGDGGEEGDDGDDGDSVPHPG